MRKTSSETIISSTNRLMLRYLRIISDLNRDTLTLTYRQFASNKTVYNATVTYINLISETTKQLDNDFKNNNVDIDRDGITHIRNRLIHKYYTVRKSIVWNFVKNDIPILERISVDYLFHTNTYTRNELIQREIFPDCLPYLNQKLIELENNILRNNNEIEMEI